MRYLVTGELAGISTMFLSVRRHFTFMVRRLTLKKLANILLCVYELKTKKSVLRSYPFYIRVEASNICNLRCTGCELGSAPMTGTKPQPRSQGLMSFQTFMESVHDFLPYLVKVNLYDEGEPLLNPELFKMIRYLSDNNVSTCVSSNFSMPMTDEYLMGLIHSGLDHLIVAIDGATPETYSRYRVGGDFHLVVENLRRLMSLTFRKNKYPLKVEIQYIDFDDNKRERDGVQRLAIELGVWKFTTVRGSSRQGWEGCLFTGTEEARRKRGCYQLWVAGTINVRGELGACDYGEDYAMPNLGPASGFSKMNLRNHPFAAELRKSFRDGKSPLHEVCRHCSLYEKQGS